VPEEQKALNTVHKDVIKCLESTPGPRKSPGSECQWLVWQRKQCL